METLIKHQTNRDPSQGLHDCESANEILHGPKITANQFDDLLQIKQERAELDHQRSTLFFFVGLSVSLLLVILVFNWKTYDQPQLVDLGNVEEGFEELIEVPLSAQLPPPPPQKVENFTLLEVDNTVSIEEIKINLDVEATEQMRVEDVVYEDFKTEDLEEEKAEEIFSILEDPATFPGGIAEFYKYVASNMKYPEVAKRLNVSGRVFVRFVVERDGSLTQVTVIKGIGAGCDEEAVRVIEGSPNWNPAKQRGRTARQYMTVPILFVLRER